MIFITFLMPEISGAALPIAGQQAVPFYRYQSSLFPSGQERIETLRRTAKSEDFKMNYLAEWNNKNYTIEGQNLVKDLHLSTQVETKKSSTLYAQRSLSSRPVRILKEKIPLTVLAIDEFWALVKTQEGLAAYIPISQLQAVFEDIGAFVTIYPTQLRMKPSESANSILILQPGERFTPMSFENGFVRVKKNHQTGYISLNYTLSKFDLAHWVFTSKQQWVPVKYRQGSMMITKDGTKIPLEEIRSLVTRANSGLITKAVDHLPPLRTQVNLLRTEVFQWNQSQLPGHGLVWWKDFVVEPVDRIAQFHSQIDLDGLLKRELFSVAFESPNSLKGLVSTQGVFHSKDGKIWTRLEQFGKSNHPVAIHPQGPWFVGNQVSLDQGRSFETYINAEHLARLIPGSSRQVKISKIEPLSNYKVQIHLDIGGRTKVLKASIGRWDWK